MPAHRDGFAGIREPVAPKVPEITLLFWVVKVLTTGMGEAASDFLGSVSRPLAGAVGLGGIGLALWLQLRARRYAAVTYWFAVAMVAVFGTMVADVLHIIGLSYFVTTPFYAVAVVVIFAIWYRLEGTLSIHSIVTTRRECLYWITVLATFALRTAAGDMTAHSVGIGYFASGLLFGGLILVPLVAWRLGLGAVASFWVAYVLTRPLGASFADWFGKPAGRSGLGWGDGWVTLGSGLIIVGFVAYLAASRRDHQHWAVVDPDEPPVHGLDESMHA